MAGARAVGTAGRGLGSSYAGSVSWHLCVRVGTRCSPPAVRGGPVARGVWGRALSPLRLPSSWGLSGPAAHVLWARVCRYGVQRCPRGLCSLCSSGAGSRGFAACVSVVRGVCGQALPLPRLSAPWAGCRGPSSTLAVGAGVRVWGPGAVPSACMPCGGRTPLGWWGPSPGGLACHRCEGRLVSDAVPPPAARPLGRVAGVPRPVCPSCGRCGRGDPPMAPQRASLQAGVARHGADGRASLGGCLPLLRGASDVRRSPSSDSPPTGRAVGVNYPCAVGAGVWVWGPNAVPLACMPCGGCVPRGSRGAVPGGGGLPLL